MGVPSRGSLAHQRCDELQRETSRDRTVPDVRRGGPRRPPLPRSHRKAGRSHPLVRGNIANLDAKPSKLVTEDPRHDTSAARWTSPRDWRFAPLLLVPLACCDFPLVLAAGAALGAAAFGGTLAAIAVLCVGISVVVVRSRRCAPDGRVACEDPELKRGRL